MRTARPTLRRYLLWLLLAALLPLLTACGQAPDEEQLRAVVSAHLTETFGDDTFALSRLRRLGSAPMAAAGDGSPRRIVYYNAVLTFERDFDFSSWDTLNIAAFANLLGATERGIEGLEQNGNRAGDEVRVRGSVTFSRKDGQWAPVSLVRPAVAAGVDGVGAGAGGLDSSRRTIERISGLLAEKAGDARARKEIIDEEPRRCISRHQTAPGPARSGADHRGRPQRRRVHPNRDDPRRHPRAARHAVERRHQQRQHG